MTDGSQDQNDPFHIRQVSSAGRVIKSLNGSEIEYVQFSPIVAGKDKKILPLKIMQVC